MSTPAEKQNRAAKRGCIWSLIGMPALLLLYLVLLSTSVFDGKAVRYPDLEIPPREKTIPLLETLEASPAWADWKANEEAREEWIAELRSESPSLPANELADKLRPELAKAMALADWLSDRPESVGLKPWSHDISPLEISFEDAGELRRLFSALRAAPKIAAHSIHAGDGLTRTSPSALRLLAKSRPVGDTLVGRLVWLTVETYSHELLAADIRPSAKAGDGARLRLLQQWLEACRPDGEQAMANAWKSEFKFACDMMVHLKRQVGNFGSSVTSLGHVGGPSWSQNLLEQWLILRVQPNKCAAILADETRSRLRNAALPARDRICPPTDTNRWKKAISLAPNAGGEVLLELGRGSYELAPQVEDRGLARHHLLRLLIGLSLYRLDHGNQLPADLAALVPAYLPELPKDPHTGEPPLYDVAAGKLAFRGMDFVPSTATVDAETEKRSRDSGRPPGVAALFEREGPQDPGVDLKAFFETEIPPAP